MESLCEAATMKQESLPTFISINGKHSGFFIPWNNGSVIYMHLLHVLFRFGMFPPQELHINMTRLIEKVDTNYLMNFCNKKQDAKHDQFLHR